MKLLTIVINCYNSSQTILNTLKSLDIDNNDFDVFIIDDGSNDNLQHIASTTINKKPNVFHYFRKENGNWGDCVNFAIRQANSQYLSILDSDDTYNSQSLSKLLDLIKNLQDKPDLIACNYCWSIPKKNKTKTVNIKISKTNKDIDICSIDKMSLYHIITIHSTIFKLDVLKKIKPLPVKTYYSDAYLMYQSLLLSNNIGFINKDLYLYNYIVHGDGQSISLTKSFQNYTHLETIFNKMLEFDKLQSLSKKKQKIVRSYISRQLYWMLLILMRWYAYTTKQKCKMLKSYCSQMKEFDNKNKQNISCFTLPAKIINVLPRSSMLFCKIGSHLVPFPFMKVTRYKKGEKKKAKELAKQQKQKTI